MGNKLMKAIALCLAALIGSPAFAVPAWELEGGANRIVLLGSIHLLRPSDYPLPGIIDELYADADVVYLEIDMDAPDFMADQMALMSMGMDSSGTGLKDSIGASAYAEVAEVADQYEIPMVMIDMMQPWFAAITITQLAMMQAGFDPQYGIEMQMLSKATRDAKEIRGLETTTESVAGLAAMSDEAQAEFLVQTVRELDQTQNVVESMLKAWRNGDVQSMETSLLDELEAMEEVHESLLVERNRRWAEQIVDLTNDSQDYLIVVGSLHLIGPDSVQAMLEDDGIRARRLR